MTSPSDESAAERRKRLDHERYMRERPMRLERQRNYYREHREEYTTSVRALRWRGGSKQKEV